MKLTDRMTSIGTIMSLSRERSWPGLSLRLPLRQVKRKASMIRDGCSKVSRDGKEEIPL